MRKTLRIGREACPILFGLKFLKAHISGYNFLFV